MKKFFLSGCMILSLIVVRAQQREGKVTYQRVSTFEARFNINGEENVVPQTRKDNFELMFANNQSLWKAVEDNNDAMETTDGGGMQIRMIATGNDDVLFTNLETLKKTEKREMFDKSFIIDDTVKALKWKISGETKTILNHNCMKAEAIQVRQSTRMTMENNKMERKEISDTLNVVAWFASDIPVSAGPAEYQGQLPGLILELHAGERQNYMATAITEKADKSSIKEPSGKKHYTAAEFKKESDKMMKEMQDNMGGGQRTIRMN
jgi:GLPGLI family protein